MRIALGKSFDNIRRKFDEPPADFARRSFDEAEADPEIALLYLRRWFENEWDGGGVELENWAEASAVVLLLFKENNDER